MNYFPSCKKFQLISCMGEYNFIQEIRKASSNILEAEEIVAMKQMKLGCIPHIPWTIGNILDCVSQTCHNTIAGTRSRADKYSRNLQPKKHRKVTNTPEDDQVDYESSKSAPPIHNNP
ncbi:unnamed protein product [Cuscuta epithymum]|uniref:DNA-directed RNA polymerase n=1 Tax=Cuscuta epithymum TaxID=186058 RepID=A0AAV0FWJ5_9ASTE|nr:unnamed protein product [Cuscuta epithymum]